MFLMGLVVESEIVNSSNPDECWVRGHQVVQKTRGGVLAAWPSVFDWVKSLMFVFDDFSLLSARFVRVV